MPRKIRVLHLITRLIIGGAQENTVFSVLGLKSRGRYDVDLASGPSPGPEGSMEEEARAGGIDLILVPYLRREINPLYDFLAFWHIFFLIKKGHYHIIHTHSSKAGVLGRLAGKLAGIKVIIHTIHGLPFHPYQSKLAYHFYLFCEKIAALMTDKIIAVSGAMVEQAKKAGVGLSSVEDTGKFIVIYSGLDVERFKPKPIDFNRRREYGLAESDIVIGKIARLFPLKGHSFLLEAVSRLKAEFQSLKILLVGDGILRPALEKEVNELGLKDKVIFAGLIRRGRIPEMIALMDIVVHTSLREGLARVIPQALAMEKPVVAFDLDGSGEIIENGINGCLVPPANVEKLTSTLKNLLSDIPRLREMGCRGRKKIEPHFNKDFMVSQIENVYRQFMN